MPRGNHTIDVDAELCADETWRLTDQQLLNATIELSQQIQMLELERIRLVRVIDKRIPADVLGLKDAKAWLIASTLLDTTSAGRIFALARGLHHHKAVVDVFETGTMPIDLAVLVLNFCEKPPAAMPAAAVGPARTALIDAASGPRANRDAVRDGIKTLQHIFDADDLPPSEDLERNTIFASTTLNGRLALVGDLDAATGEQFLTVLSTLSKPTPAHAGCRDERTPAKRRADAFTEMIERYLAIADGPTEGGERPHLNLHIRADHLADIHRNRHHGEELAPEDFVPEDLVLEQPTDCPHEWNQHWDRQSNQDIGEVPKAGGAPADWTIAGGWDPEIDGNARAYELSRDDRWTEFEHWAAWAEQLGDVTPPTTTKRTRDGSFYRDLIADSGVGWVPWTGSVTVTTARRLTCDCILTPIFLDEHHVPLDLGRTVRTATSKQRRALVARDRGCAFPGCTQPPAWTHAHHIQHWIDGGPTNLDNLVLLCGHHHRMLHHSDWEVAIGINRHPEFTPPRSVDPQRRPIPSNRSSGKRSFRTSIFGNTTSPPI